MNSKQPTEPTTSAPWGNTLYFLARAASRGAACLVLDKVLSTALSKLLPHLSTSTTESSSNNIAKSLLLGLAIGIPMTLASTITSFVVQKIFPMKQSKNMDKLMDILLKDPIAAAIEAPLQEECLFRGLVQPVSDRLFSIVLPGQSTLAKNVSLVFSSCAFGAIHLSNDGNLAQPICATFTGLYLGILKNKYGLGCSIGAHVTNNTILCLLMRTLFVHDKN